MNATSTPLSLGLVQLRNDSESVSDADEEVFLLYTTLQQSPHHVQDGSTGFRGLGHIDSRQDSLSVKFELKPFITIESNHPAKKLKGKKGANRDTQERTIEVVLAQDKTALRSRKGDTGSVLWRASVEFAQLVLQQHHHRLEDALLNRVKLADAHVLELGAGTGLLSIVLSPLVRHYTATDIEALVPLIRKNVLLNRSILSSAFEGVTSNVSIEELDWEALHQTQPSLRSRLFPASSGYRTDLILVIDCLYNPSLLPSLCTAIDHCSTTNHTSVLVVAELRAEDVIRDFLALWIALEGWEVHRVSGLLDGIYAMWVGWKRPPNP